MSGLIARKIGMSRVFLDGNAIPVTYLQVEPNIIVRLKNTEKDGYNAVILGIGKKIVRTRKGNELQKFRFLKEWRVDSLEGLTVGSTLAVETIPEASLVTVTSISKGKGFQGVMKRYNFAGGPATHGSHFKREPGSIGMREIPGRVHKGKRMAGHMGLDQVTLHARPVVICDKEKGVLAVKGPVPGPNGSAVYLTVESPHPSKGAANSKA
ncbi:50S ribosomal protein L3 [Candidatus Peribacteria bacterium RIFCSPHIGHO2_01_FULL_55_13]|nr:MAG: 50S ribosomal protein L3 [Candidatus Peribacteria bacterium RIFCSPHIGHO2_01_FULL_55_13]OGJ64239.1 MAG: 50S ribosomal protein L3 [Candidatus Peribacteria bacterium RIFCSPHIGHO2_12_FULL_55_11]